MCGTTTYRLSNSPELREREASDRLLNKRLLQYLFYRHRSFCQWMQIKKETMLGVHHIARGDVVAPST